MQNKIIIQISNKLFENLRIFKYFGMGTINQNCTHKEIKSRQNLRNYFYHPIQNSLPSNLPTEKVNIKIFKFTALPIFLCGCNSWSLILREEHRLKVIRNRMQIGIFGPKKEEVTGGWKKTHMRSFIIYTLQQIQNGSKFC
jgi:hypothetical protein